MMRLDTHHHFWTLSNPFTHWPPSQLARIHRDFGAADLQPHLHVGGIDATILVQAAPSFAETQFLLRIAETCSFVKGVVGWIDFEAPDALSQLTELASNPLLRGLRPMVQDCDEERWILRPEFAPIFEAMVERRLCFDALVRPAQLDDIITLASRYKDLPIVLDHGGKPQIGNGTQIAWMDDVASLARRDNVYCKLSGLWTEANGQCSVEVIRPYVQHLLDCFGTSRVMWGSDWPVIELSGHYEDWLSQCEIIISDISKHESHGIFGLNGKNFYGIS